ncbi:putative membrane protein YdjX (TVP38/TMEM64 family) [Actinocrispum wychmicini]|uniref:TVP38/TMEM64 family membrane protein n=1 Tax=Actinocrispum wychmicini TaxID=1213861 RepID=A0A4R2IIL4_9PSEU|nr:putative membrane protein YdjX (TVP38/TMEM64 family) [Actinocrispum wychmicini]
MAVGLLAAVVVAAFVLPVPKAGELRSWAEGAGAAAPVLMFLAYVVVTLVPIPRTVFSLASGLLLGPAVGVCVALAATVVSGWLSFVLARSIGRRMVARHLEHKTVRSVDERLTSGGWMAVASIRLIPVAPFLPVNYACGVSSVRTWPYLVGTVVGSLPGTIAVVVLGDTLTGSTPPALLVVSAACAVVGLAGLWFAFRRRRSVDQRDEFVE